MIESVIKRSTLPIKRDGSRQSMNIQAVSRRTRSSLLLLPGPAIFFFSSFFQLFLSDFAFTELATSCHLPFSFITADGGNLRTMPCEYNAAGGGDAMSHNGPFSKAGRTRL